MDTTPPSPAPPDQPYRGPVEGLPTGLRFPPKRLRMFKKWQLRKQWRYVSFWSPDLALCAARVHVGPLSSQYWAVWDRTGDEPDGTFTTSYYYLRRPVHVSDDALKVRIGDVSIDIAIEPTERFYVYRPEGRAYIWSRKLLCLDAEATVAVEGPARTVRGTAFVDFNAGYHFRKTRWKWAAGAFTLPDGRQVAWNAITGLFDTSRNSERTIWVDGVGTEIERVQFSHGANVVTFHDGNRLTFIPIHRLRKRVGLFLIKSKYEHAFGLYSGTLPGGIEVRDAVGVRERQDALW
jgi:Protein of unknown function (DUF2804)